MRCCDCEFRNECKEEDTVLTCFVKCNIREEKLKQKAEQLKMLNDTDVKYFKKQPDGLVLEVGAATGYFPKDFNVEAIKTHMSVVRCEECRYKEECNQYVLISGDEGELAFCSYGERRDK